MGLDHFNDDSVNFKDILDEKERVKYRAVAKGKITVSRAVFDAIMEGAFSKDSVLEVAKNAAIAAAKKSWEMIPMCHAVPIGSCDVDFEAIEETFEIYCTCTVKTCAEKSVEAEALTAVGVALLTIYDMCKAIDKKMQIDQIHLVEKSGGESECASYESYKN